MTAFKYGEMMCNHCVSRIDTTLSEAELDHKIDLNVKAVTIRGCESCAAKTAGILDDLGFMPVAI